MPHVHAAGDGAIRLALIGCGNRGTGAVADAFASSGGPVKLYAMADLFEDRVRIDKMSSIAHAIDAINERFGKHKLSLGPSLFLEKHRKTARDVLPWRKTDLLKGETRRQRLNIPRLAIEV